MRPCAFTRDGGFRSWPVYVRPGFSGCLRAITLTQPPPRGGPACRGACTRHGALGGLSTFAGCGPAWGKACLPTAPAAVLYEDCGGLSQVFGAATVPACFARCSRAQVRAIAMCDCSDLAPPSWGPHGVEALAPDTGFWGGLTGPGRKVMRSHAELPSAGAVSSLRAAAAGTFLALLDLVPRGLTCGV